MITKKLFADVTRALENEINDNREYIYEKMNAYDREKFLKAIDAFESCSLSDIYRQKYGGSQSPVIELVGGTTDYYMRILYDSETDDIRRASYITNLPLWVTKKISAKAIGRPLSPNNLTNDRRIAIVKAAMEKAQEGLSRFSFADYRPTYEPLIMGTLEHMLTCPMNQLKKTKLPKDHHCGSDCYRIDGWRMLYNVGIVVHMPTLTVRNICFDKVEKWQEKKEGNADVAN